MPTLIIKNNTASNQLIADQGTFVPASGQLPISDNVNLALMGSSNSLRTLVSAATVTLNDGSSDLAILDALSYLNGLWASSGTLMLTPLALGYIEGALLAWVSATTVSVGAAGGRSVLAASGNAMPIVWTGVLNANITVAGAGGLQTGQVEAANTWYQVLVIADTTGVNAPAALLVPAGVSFNQAGYNVFRRVGWVRNNASSNLLAFFQSGNGSVRIIFYNEPVATVQLLTDGAATAFTNVDLKPLVPPIGRALVTLLLGFNNAPNGGAAGHDLRVRPADSALTNPPWKVQPGVRLGAMMQIPVGMFTDANQVIQYAVTNANNRADVSVIGYEDDL
jgi:hypothetical protein